MRADDHFRSELDRLRKDGLNRALRAIDGSQSARLLLNGRKVVSLCSNNYLGLADDPRLIEAAQRAARDFGVGSGASRLVSGSMRLHHQLEDQIAAFKHAEAALLFNSGYHANLGAISALVGAGDAVFSDELNHASLIDGCRLSRAMVRVYRHASLESLEEMLSATEARRRLIVTDSVFSMDGDLAPLAGICDLAERYDAMVMVDEAHATGVIGRHGAGLAEELGLQARITVQMGTLGKAIGSFGAYVAGSRAMIDYLVNTARTFIFTTALPAPVIAAAGAGLEIVRREPERRDGLRRNARNLRAGLQDAGFAVSGPSDGHIIPVMIGGATETMSLSASLLESGVFAQGIRPPTVPAGTSRIRATAMATHSDEDLALALAAFRAAGSTP